MQHVNWTNPGPWSPKNWSVYFLCLINYSVGCAEYVNGKGNLTKQLFNDISWADTCLLVCISTGQPVMTSCQDRYVYISHHCHRLWLVNWKKLTSLWSMKVQVRAMTLQYSRIPVGHVVPAWAACELELYQRVELRAFQQRSVVCWSEDTRSRSPNRQRVAIRHHLLRVVLINDILSLVSCTIYVCCHVIYL